MENHSCSEPLNQHLWAKTLRSTMWCCHPRWVTLISAHWLLDPGRPWERNLEYSAVTKQLLLGWFSSHHHNVDEIQCSKRGHRFCLQTKNPRTSSTPRPGHDMCSRCPENNVAEAWRQKLVHSSTLKPPRMICSAHIVIKNPSIIAQFLPPHHPSI